MKNRIIVLIWITIGFAAALSAANKKFTLVIDAGHGGHDAGAKGAFSMEKNINLNVALAFGQYVENNWYRLFPVQFGQVDPPASLPDGLIYLQYE